MNEGIEKCYFSEGTWWDGYNRGREEAIAEVKAKAAGIKDVRMIKDRMVEIWETDLDQIAEAKG